MRSRIEHVFPPWSNAQSGGGLAPALRCLRRSVSGVPARRPCAPSAWHPLAAPGRPSVCPSQHLRHDAEDHSEASSSALALGRSGMSDIGAAGGFSATRSGGAGLNPSGSLTRVTHPPCVGAAQVTAFVSVACALVFWNGSVPRHISPEVPVVPKASIAEVRSTFCPINPALAYLDDLVRLYPSRSRSRLRLAPVHPGDQVAHFKPVRGPVLECRLFRRLVAIGRLLERLPVTSGSCLSPTRRRRFRVHPTRGGLI
jgi:hypothetical protein